MIKSLPCLSPVTSVKFSKDESEYNTESKEMVKTTPLHPSLMKRGLDPKAYKEYELYEKKKGSDMS